VGAAGAAGRAAAALEVCTACLLFFFGVVAKAVYNACAQGVEAGAAGLRRGAAAGLEVAAAEGAGALVGGGGVRRGAVADSGVATSVHFLAWWVTIEFLEAAVFSYNTKPTHHSALVRGNGVPSIAGWFAGKQQSSAGQRTVLALHVHSHLITQWVPYRAHAQLGCVFTLISREENGVAVNLGLID
jgi:hypothetical protein